MGKRMVHPDICWSRNTWLPTPRKMRAVHHRLQGFDQQMRIQWWNDPLWKALEGQHCGKKLEFTATFPLARSILLVKTSLMVFLAIPLVYDPWNLGHETPFPMRKHVRNCFGYRIEALLTNTHFYSISESPMQKIHELHERQFVQRPVLLLHVIVVTNPQRHPFCLMNGLPGFERRGSLGELGSSSKNG